MIPCGCSCCLLRKEDGSFALAYMLADSRMERSGRSSRNVPTLPVTHILTCSAAIVASCNLSHAAAGCYARRTAALLQPTCWQTVGWSGRGAAARMRSLSLSLSLTPSHAQQPLWWLGMKSWLPKSGMSTHIFCVGS